MTIDGLTLSVVIPSFRRVPRIAPLVDAYRRQGVDQIVVVLDGPHPADRHLVDALRRDPGITLVELARNGGLARARIAGLHATTCEIILITDDDIVPGPDLVERHRAFHAQTRRGVLVGYMPVRLNRKRGRDESATRLYSRDYENQVAEWEASPPLRIFTSFWAGNVSLPRSLYLEAEQLLPTVRLDYNEDLDLGLRLLRLGASVAFDRAARADHLHERPLDGFLRECVIRGRSVADMRQRWLGDLPEQLDSLAALPGRVRGPLRTSLLLLERRDSAGALEFALIALYRCLGLLALWRLQDRVAGLLRRGLALRGHRLRTRELAASAGRLRRYPSDGSDYERTGESL